jgi:hypothetical protein
LAAFALGNLPARATAPIDLSNANGTGSGWLILAFRDNTNSYLVRLGTTSTFTSQAQGQTFSLSTIGNSGSGIGNIGTDLNSIFPGWQTSSSVYWGIFAWSSGSIDPGLYASKARTSPGTQSTPFTGPTSQGDRSATQNQIAQVENWFQGKTSTTNSNYAAVQPNTVTGSASYITQVATPSVTDFGSTSSWNSIEGNFANGTSNAVLDLYRITAVTGVISTPGYFTINDSGSVNFTTVPEPSTYAMMVGGLGLLIGFQRSRSRLQKIKA